FVLPGRPRPFPVPLVALVLTEVQTPGVGSLAEYLLRRGCDGGGRGERRQAGSTGQQGVGPRRRPGAARRPTARARTWGACPGAARRRPPAAATGPLAPPAGRGSRRRRATPAPPAGARTSAAGRAGRRTRGTPGGAAPRRAAHSASPPTPQRVPRA